MSDEIITTLFCTVLILLALWGHDAGANEFVRFRGCTFTEDSSTIGGIKIHGPSSYVDVIYLRKKEVIGLQPIDPVNDPGIDCTLVLLSNGKTLLLIGSKDEIFSKLFQAVVK